MILGFFNIIFFPHKLKNSKFIVGGRTLRLIGRMEPFKSLFLPLDFLEIPLPLAHHLEME